MTTQIEAIKLAIDWIGEAPDRRTVSAGKMVSILAEALAEQPAQQEPVAHINSNGVVHAAGYPWGDKEVLRPLVCGDTTPQPPAQPLTDDKYEAIVEDLADWGRYVEVDTAHQSLEAHVREVLTAHGITKGT